MAKNMTQRYTKTEVWEVGSNKAPGIPVVQTHVTVDGTVLKDAPQPGFTLTGSGDYVAPSATVGPYTITAAAGMTQAAGLGATKATVALDGAFRYPVTGATNATVGGTLVYAVVSGGNVTSLTLTNTGNTPFGKIDRFMGETSGTECSVWVGRFADNIS
jgi:hypothetical protein